MMALDIGPETVELFCERDRRSARTIVWNGPMGVFEIDHFAQGTMKIAERGGRQCRMPRPSSAAEIPSQPSRKAGVADKITHISTGGGASLEFLEGKKLPGVEALTDKSSRRPVNPPFLFPEGLCLNSCDFRSLSS